MNKDEIKTILDDHAKWLRDEGGKQANLSEADLSEANLSWADLRRANLSWADLSEANLSWADLRRADLSGADLRGANLRWADLSGADLRGANLRWANLRWADLRGANLRGADLSGADLQVVTTINRVEVSWSAHGECGRKLLAVQIGDEVRYFCGCFSGTLADLRTYIANGDGRYKTSRTIAADFCEARMREMMEVKS